MRTEGDAADEILALCDTSFSRSSLLLDSLEAHGDPDIIAEHRRGLADPEFGAFDREFRGVAGLLRPLEGAVLPPLRTKLTGLRLAMKAEVAGHLEAALDGLDRRARERHGRELLGVEEVGAASDGRREQCCSYPRSPV